MAEALKYPIGIQFFPEIIENGYLYVDKTAYIRKIISEGKYFFLSRPRRFGKSLLLSTFQAYFEGRRDLFKGLSIDDDSIDWTPHPVIMLSLNTLDPKSEDSLRLLFSNILNRYEKLYGMEEKVDELPQNLRTY